LRQDYIHFTKKNLMKLWVSNMLSIEKLRDSQLFKYGSGP